MMAERKKILWLVSWYPNKYDPFDGDFIQRHARTVAIYHDVHVFFIKQHEAQLSIENTWSNEKVFSAQIIYLPKQKGWLGKWENYKAWKNIYKAQLGLLIERTRPDIVHVHVPWKAGLIALWIKKKYKIPFIVTEHWGIYNKVAEDNIYTQSFIVRRLLKRIYREAKEFVSVSTFLGDGVNETLVRKPFIVIPNVVDTSLFFPSKEKATPFTFIHVSNMVLLKNVAGIISAFEQYLKETNFTARLILIGNRDNHYVTLAERLGLLNKSIFFKGELPYEQVAREMQQAHAFVLNSNIENSPCVIGEALCCGLPVIATNVGGVPELVSGPHHILINAGDTTALTKAMHQLQKQYNENVSFEIAASALQKFSYAAVGARLADLYG